MLPKVYDHKITSCSILVGPEGDFSNEEYEYAKESNFSSVSLGDNILRVETAAISVFAYIKIMKNSESNE